MVFMPSMTTTLMPGWRCGSSERRGRAVPARLEAEIRQACWIEMGSTAERLTLSMCSKGRSRPSQDGRRVLPLMWRAGEDDEEEDLAGGGLSLDVVDDGLDETSLQAYSTGP